MGRLRASPRQGFTLIELLVVIGIISVLAAILLPVFAQAREKARQATCLSNIHQIGVGMMMYSSDADGMYPPAMVSVPGEKLFEMSWLKRILPYVRSAQVLTCPDSGHSSLDWQSSQDLVRNYGYAPSSSVQGLDYITILAEPFGQAGWEGIGGFAGVPLKRYQRDVPGHSESSIARPGDTIIVCDAPWFDWGFSVTDTSQDLLFPSPRHMREASIQLPDGARTPEGIVNCLFADGHARGLKHDSFWEIRRGGSTRFGTIDVFTHFWPYD